MSIFSKLRLRSHTRLFLIFICTLVIPLIILTVVFLQSYRNIYYNEVQQSIRREIDSIATTFDTQCQTAATYIANISQDSNLREYLLAAQDPEYTVPADTPSLRSVIQRYMTGKPSLLNSQVIVLTPSGDAIYGNNHLGVPENGPVFSEMVRDSYRSPLKNTFWFYEQQFHDVPNDDAYIYIARPVTASSNWQAIGYVVLRVRNSDFISIYLSSTSVSRSIFVLDSAGEIISSIDNLNSRSSVTGDSNQHLLLVSEPLQTDDWMIYSTRLSNLWYLMSVTDTSTSSQPQLAAATTLYFFALLFCIALTLFVSYVMSKQFVKPVNVLTARMQEVEQGNLHSRAVINTHDEFEDLANSYNKMIQRVEDLMRQIIFEQEQKRESDIRMLQAQINPHFLYNTLASIRYMIYTTPPQEVDKILLALSRFLKYVLSNADTVYVTLDREFEQM